MSCHRAYPMFDPAAAGVPDDLCPIATEITCAICWLYCPVQCIVEKPAWFDMNLATCKGCGICANECPQRAITMVEEAGA